MSLLNENKILNKSKEYTFSIQEELNSTKLQFFQKVVFNSSEYRNKEILASNLSKIRKSKIL